MDNILLESGTNELELLIFSVGNQYFGVNVAKVMEIMRYQKITQIPGSTESFEGVFTPRDKVISVIDLHKTLSREIPENTEGILLICHFNQIDIAFHVTSVKGIQRISWESIEKSPEISTKDSSNLSTGIVKIDKDIIIILDFEKIVSELNTTMVLNTDGIDNTIIEGISEKHIVIAEDSVFLNNMIVQSLGNAGYTKVSHFENGKDAWNFLSNLENPSKTIACVISDIEMPKMDGHNLCKRIKENENMKDIPVYLFSSLINDQLRHKGESVGANEQFSKPQINELINYLKKHI